MCEQDDNYYYTTTQALLSNDFIRTEVFSSHQSRDGVLRDYCDGMWFKKNEIFLRHPNALQIILYYDDIEVANPLGAKAGVHKLGKQFSLHVHSECMYTVR